MAASSKNSRDSAPLQRAISFESPLEWKQALACIPHSFFHTWEHSYAMHLTHKLPAYLYCFEHADVRIVCPFIERPFRGYIDIATPYGFSGFAGNADYPDLPHYWNDFVRSRGYISAFLALHPLFSRPGYASREATHELKGLYFLDPALHSDDFIGRCSESRRRNIRRWRRGQFSVITDRFRLSRFVLDHFQEFLRRRNANSSYGFSPLTMQFILSLDRVLAIGAAHENEIKAVHVSAFTAYGAEYLFGFSLPGWEHQSSGLIWQASTFLHDLGITPFNLGGGLTDGDSLDDFKRRFGAERRALLAMKEVIRAEIYNVLCREVGVDPQACQKFFPGYRSVASA